MSRPLLSVCLITYNQAQYIKKAVDTVLMQKVNFTWELVIADDCSTDGTREILLEYKRKFPDFIKLILQKNNVGPEKNWLDLMAHPRSRYVLYTEGDDYFSDPGKLQRQVDFLEAHNDFSLCFHPVKVIYEDGSRSSEIFPSPEYRFNKNTLELKDLLARNFIQTNSAMYRWRFIKENLKDVFPKNITPGDWFLHILHAQVGKIGFINKVMSIYRRHPRGVWWESHVNHLDFVAKHWETTIKTHNAILELCGSNAEYKKILDSAVSNTFQALLEIDKKRRSKLVNAAVKKFPDNTVEYIKQLQKNQENKEKDIQKLNSLLAKKDQEIRDIVLSKSWQVTKPLRVIRGKLTK